MINNNNKIKPASPYLAQKKSIGRKSLTTYECGILRSRSRGIGDREAMHGINWLPTGEWRFLDGIVER